MRICLFLVISIFMFFGCSGKGIEGRWVADNHKYLFLHEDGRFDATLSDSPYYLFGDWYIKNDTLLILQGQYTTRNFDKFNLAKAGVDIRNRIRLIYTIKKIDGEKLYLGEYDSGSEYFEEYQPYKTPEGYPLNFTRQKLKPVRNDLKYWTAEKNMWRSQSKNLDVKEDMSAEQRCKDAIDFAISYLEFYKYQNIPALIAAIVLPVVPAKKGYIYVEEHMAYDNSEKWKKVFDAESDANRGEWCFKWMYKCSDFSKFTDKESPIDRHLLSINYYRDNFDKASAEYDRLVEEYEADTTSIGDFDLDRLMRSGPKQLSESEIKDALILQIKREIKYRKRLRYSIHYSYVDYCRYVPLKIKEDEISLATNEDRAGTVRTHPFQHISPISTAQKKIEQAFEKVVFKPKREFQYPEDRCIDVLEQILSNL